MESLIDLDYFTDVCLFTLGKKQEPQTFIYSKNLQLHYQYNLVNRRSIKEKLVIIGQLEGKSAISGGY